MSLAKYLVWVRRHHPGRLETLTKVADDGSRAIRLDELVYEDLRDFLLVSAKPKWTRISAVHLLRALAQTGTIPHKQQLMEELAKFASWREQMHRLSQDPSYRKRLWGSFVLAVLFTRSRKRALHRIKCPGGAGYLRALASFEEAR